MESETYSDDSTVSNDDGLLRRVPKAWFVLDENLGRVRPSSAAFSNDKTGSPMSVAIESAVIADGRKPVDVLQGKANFALVRITAGFARQHQQGIQRDPIEVEPAHALVFGEKTRPVKDAFAMNCEWAVPPSPENIQELRDRARN